MKFEQALALLREGKFVHNPGSMVFYRIETGMMCRFSKSSGSGEFDTPNFAEILRDDWELYEPPWDGIVPPEPRLPLQFPVASLVDWGRLGWETARRERELRLNASSSNEA